jgi:hypothetical protein
MSKKIVFWLAIAVVVSLGIITGVFFIYKSNYNQEVILAQKKLDVFTANITKQKVEFQINSSSFTASSLGVTDSSLNATADEKLQLLQKVSMKKTGWVLFWEYCGTETFKTIVVSVVVAILLAVLGHIFKINEIWETMAREQRKKFIDEQVEAIKQTATMWDNLYCIVSELRFYDPVFVKVYNDSVKEAKDKKNNIYGILEKLENYASKAEEVVNTWHFLFPELSKAGRVFRENLVKHFLCNQRLEYAEQICKEGQLELGQIHPKSESSSCSESRHVHEQRQIEWKLLSLIIEKEKLQTKNKKTEFCVLPESNTKPRSRLIINQDLFRYRVKLLAKRLRIWLNSVWFRKNQVTKKLEEDINLYFPDIRAGAVILDFINILYEVTCTTGYYIQRDEQQYLKGFFSSPPKPRRKNKTQDKQVTEFENEAKKLQDSLGVVQDAIKDNVHQPMLKLLKYSVTPIEGWGHNKEDDAYKRTQLLIFLDSLYKSVIFTKNIELRCRIDKKAEGTISDWELKYHREGLYTFAKEMCLVSYDEEQADMKAWQTLKKYTKQNG